MTNIQKLSPKSVTNIDLGPSQFRNPLEVSQSMMKQMFMKLLENTIIKIFIFPLKRGFIFTIDLGFGFFLDKRVHFQ